MKSDVGRAFMVIRAIDADPDIPIGIKLRRLGEVVELAEQVRRKLTMQLGMDMAKYLMAKGIEPDGRTVEQHLTDD